tara:strand:- start:480 stop:641 length:162 start_codon:yes stop_codon:yes gene_type:complete
MLFILSLNLVILLHLDRSLKPLHMYWSAVAAAVVDIFMVVLVVLAVIELALFQ